MLTKDLFNHVLIEPVTLGADRLYVLSGYASPSIVYRHLSSNAQFSVDLIIGMVKKDGMRLGSHRAFQQISATDFYGRFSCRYAIASIPAHLKLYGWYRGEEPMAGFVGSANYTQLAFSHYQLEALEECDASMVKQVFDTVGTQSMNCLDSAIQSYVSFYDERRVITKKTKSGEMVSIDGELVETDELTDSVSISLLASSGTVGDRSGLNWGQRLNRNHNQAYIPLQSRVYNTDFFPPIGEHFIVLTDDGKYLDCVRAQSNGKAIHTYRDNSLLGTYLRHRLGVPSGHKVTVADFVRYGRSDVTVYKIDNETYYMDFSVAKGKQ